jgi:hypothetical protein
MAEFKFNKYGKSLATRQLGETIGKEIKDLLVPGSKLILDFSDVRVVSNAFCNGCFGILLDEYGFDGLKSMSTFANVEPFVELVIKSAIIELV